MSQVFPCDDMNLFLDFRGVSSTVRRCIEKSSGKEYAVKIIDLTGENDDEDLINEIRTQTRREMNILRMCAEHAHISKYHHDKNCLQMNNLEIF